MSLAQDTFQAAVSPPSLMNNVDWACKYVRLPHSARSPQFDISATPWLRWPMEQIADNANREVVLMAPVGSGKTTMLEGLLPWIIAEEPGPTLVTFQTDDDARDWVDLRFHPALKINEKVKPLIPAGKNKGNFRKKEILFAHMPLYVGGANISSLQSKSIRWVYGDEVWLWGAGMLDYARRRTHDRWNSRVVLVSQGGIEDDQLDGAFKEADVHDFCFECPKCKKVQPWVWKQIKYKHVKNKADEWDWVKIGNSVHYECAGEDCKAKFKDTAKVRRSLSASMANTESRGYISRGNNHIPRKIAGTYPAMAVWWIEWKKLVQEWITARDQLKKGNKAPLKSFIQQRLAQTWEEPTEAPVMKMGDDVYRMKDFANGEKWEHESHRFISVDVQGDHFWLVCRAWSVDHGSRLLYAEKVTTWEAVRIIQKRFNVANKGVFVDRGYRPDEVGHESHASKTNIDNKPWIPLLGDKAEGYPIKNRRTKRVEIHAISNVYTAKTNRGLVYKYIKHSNLLNKDCLTDLLKGGSYGVGTDHSVEYKTQMQSEHKVRKPSGKLIYEKIKDHYQNHLWDCEVMQVVAATIYGLLKTSTDAGAE